MLTPMTEKEENAIIKSVVDCIEKNNIELLTKKAYNFVMLSSGFIAHYNHEGFKYHYENVRSLRADIINFQPQNQWANFRPKEKDGDYMMQKKKIYNAICAKIKKVKSID